MIWKDYEVDGVNVKVRSAIGTIEWNKAFERTMEYEAEGLADRENMSHGFADSFMDAGDVTLVNGESGAGYVRNSVTPAEEGMLADLFPAMTGYSSPSGERCWTTSADNTNQAGWMLFDKAATGSNTEYWNAYQENICVRDCTNIAVPITEVYLEDYDGTYYTDDYEIIYTTDTITDTPGVVGDLYTKYTWHTALSVVNEGFIDGLYRKTLTTPIPVEATAWGIRPTHARSNGYINLRRLEGWGTVPYKNVLPAMTSNTTPSGVCSVSSQRVGDAYQAYKAADRDNSVGSHWSSFNGDPHWWMYDFEKVTTITGYSVQLMNGSNPQTYSYVLQGSDDGVSFTDLESVQNSRYFSSGTKHTHLVAEVEYRYYRVYFSSTSNGTAYVGEIELFGLCAGEESHPVAVTVSPWNPVNDVSAVKVKVWIEDLDNSGAISVGNTGSDLIEAYLSYDGNTSFGSALSFSDEPREIYDGANIYIFTSDEVDISTEAVSSIGLKIQSFDRGSGAPNIKVHGYLVVGMEVVG